ncbi:hypothetical protein JXQ31_19280 [candidate division KSB1 bacterium]|nr:hypothetical protein [candidate division KSB1 bacterium]
MQKNKSLKGRTLYIPQMSYVGARCVAAAFNSLGFDARPSPDSDSRTLELARKYLSGDECLPEAVTLGNFLKVTEMPDYDPDKTAFFMPTSNGPCRFGHYLPLACKVFQQRGEDVLLFSPSSSSGYENIGEEANDLLRTTWRGVLCSDILRKLQLKTRPYEREKGSTDRVFHKSLDRVCEAISIQNVSHKIRLKKILAALMHSRDEFRAVKVDKTRKKLLIGIVGEIYCRLNDFSNDFIINKIEQLGGEVWMSDVSEWVFYTNDEERVRLIRQGKRFSGQMLNCLVRQKILKKDEKALLSLFKDDFIGYEEPHHVLEILDRSQPYLPRDGSHGEMVMSAGKTVWYYEKGASGVIDISPFTCMNGIITEAVYPKLSRELGGFPIRVFYFDGNIADLESDLEIFMELARNFADRNSSLKVSEQELVL